MTLGAVSQHLGVLGDAGLVACRREGRHRYCRARRTELGPRTATMTLAVSPDRTIESPTVFRFFTTRHCARWWGDAATIDPVVVRAASVPGVHQATRRQGARSDPVARSSGVPARNVGRRLAHRPSPRGAPWLANDRPYVRVAVAWQR